MLEQSQAEATLATLPRIALTVVVICCLAISLATRFTIQGAEVQRINTVKSQSSEAKRQHVAGNNNQIEAAAPTVTLILLQPSRPLVAVSKVVAPPVFSKIWLYNRPPPSC